jgi:hypothetical protein
MFLHSRCGKFVLIRVSLDRKTHSKGIYRDEEPRASVVRKDDESAINATSLNREKTR